jgi:lambda repressor-like predicted transcriptional regulator
MAKQVEQQVQAPAQPQLPSAADLIKQHGTKSAAIRALTAAGHSRTVVAKALGIKYQHVRNVLITPIKKQKVVVAK